MAVGRTVAYDAGMSDVQGLLLDIDGTITISWKPIPGAVEAMSKLRDSGLSLRFLTNTTARTQAELVNALNKAGIGAANDEVVTAPVATAAFVRDKYPGRSCFLVAKPHIATDLDGIDLVEEDAEVVIVGGADDAFSYERLNRAFGMIWDGAALVAMHRNLFWRTDTGMSLDAGAYVHALEKAAMVSAQVAGKPSPAFFEQAVEMLGVDASSVVMVGDDIESDVLAAQRNGITGVLVKTGKYHAGEVEHASGTPDFVIDSIAGLPEILGL